MLGRRQITGTDREGVPTINGLGQAIALFMAEYGRAPTELSMDRATWNAFHAAPLTGPFVIHRTLPLHDRARGITRVFGMSVDIRHSLDLPGVSWVGHDFDMGQGMPDDPAEGPRPWLGDYDHPEYEQRP